MHSVYVLQSTRDGELYIGYSADVRKRVDLHNEGKVPATRARKPLQLLYCELYANRKDAMQRELYLKTGWGRNYLRKVLHHALAERDSKI